MGMIMGMSQFEKLVEDLADATPEERKTLLNEAGIEVGFDKNVWYSRDKLDLKMISDDDKILLKNDRKVERTESKYKYVIVVKDKYSPTGLTDRLTGINWTHFMVLD